MTLLLYLMELALLEQMDFSSNTTEAVKWQLHTIVQQMLSSGWPLIY